MFVSRLIALLILAQILLFNLIKNGVHCLPDKSLQKCTYNSVLMSFKICQKGRKHSHPHPNLPNMRDLGRRREIVHVNAELKNNEGRHDTASTNDSKEGSLNKKIEQSSLDQGWDYCKA